MCRGFPVDRRIGFLVPTAKPPIGSQIWMSADTTTLRVNRVKSGWVGRYLQEEFAGYPDDFPNGDMPDPLAIQISNAPTLDLQGNIYSMGLSITDPENVYTFDNPFHDYTLNAAPANKELGYIRVITEKTKIYSDIIRAAYRRSSTLATYPTANSLADQLKIVARLIKGGLKTRVYTVCLGGFDTHKKPGKCK